MENAVRRQIFLVIAVLALVFVLIFAMTVAWYTNVTRTNGLQFRTETWGFSEENITIGNNNPDTPFTIRPGGQGIIPLHIDNSTNYQTVKAVLNVDKSTMTDVELQKRVYFFVDEPKTYTFTTQQEETEPESEETEEPGPEANSETVFWQYLGKERVSSYTYTIFGGNSLTLSENYQSDAPLKWYWVDTLEGYYFRGSVTAQSAAEEEYLRPIEYDLDKAAFETDEEGRATTLNTVNNGTPVREFLMSVFASDGYEGSTLKTEPGSESSYDIEEVQCEGKTYYKIAADENGYGVWAYLMDANEITAANLYDSAVGSETALSATISITAFNVETAAQTVAGTEALKEVLSSDESATVRLDAPISLTEPLSVSGDMTLDLNQFAIEYSGTENTYAVFDVENGSSLTLLNGSIIGSGSGSGNGASTVTAAISSEGGAVTLSGVTVRGFDSAVSIDDSAGDADSQIKLTNCDFETPSTSVLCFGNGSRSEARSRIIIENSKIKSDYIGISGNGTSSDEKQLWGTELIILNSEIEGYWAAIYQPQQQSYTSITGSRLTGYTGIAVKGGTIDLYASTVIGTGEATPAKASGSGWTDTGDAVYVEASYGWMAEVIIRGTENELVTKGGGYLLQLFGVEGKGPGRIVVEKGAFASDLVNWNNIGTFTMNYAPAQPQEP